MAERQIAAVYHESIRAIARGAWFALQRHGVGVYDWPKKPFGIG